MGYEIVRESDAGVVKHFFGVVTSGELVDAVLDAQGGAAFEKVRYILDDYLDVEAISLHPADSKLISALYSMTSLFNPKIRIAYVTRSSAIAALANQYVESPSNVFPAKTFATLADARSWLVADAEGARPRTPSPPQA